MTHTITDTELDELEALAEAAKFGTEDERGFYLTAADWWKMADYIHRSRTAIPALIAALRAERAANRLALPILERDRESVVESHSMIKKGEDGEFHVVPDTLDPEVIDDVAAYDAAIRALKETKE